ncbi:hypothetical protein SAMN06265347_10440 [Halobellus salinus]|nr:hypothetical protein SAMN06265347_10440 [Halobellus salinus]
MPPAVDASYKQDILVMTDIGDFLAERYLDIVSSESATYPSQYTWTNEYCSATYEFPP